MAIYSCRGVQLGYVTSQRAVLVRRWFADARDITAVFQGLSSTGAWIRVALDGEQPEVDPEASGSLPWKTPAAPVDPDEFYPDPTYDE